MEAGDLQGRVGRTWVQWNNLVGYFRVVPPLAWPSLTPPQPRPPLGRPGRVSGGGGGSEGAGAGGVSTSVGGRGSDFFIFFIYL